MCFTLAFALGVACIIGNIILKNAFLFWPIVLLKRVYTVSDLQSNAFSMLQM